jgi:hypothetical protein
MTGLETILVHTDTPGAFPDRGAAWLALSANGGRSDLRLLLRERGDLLFAVDADSRAADLSRPDTD